jgi:hypothetical protein
MTNKEKLEALKAFLTENNVRFIENHVSNFGVTMDLKLPDLMIAVFMSDGDKEKEHSIYNASTGKWKLHYVYKPFFIRESESVEFVLEKMKNCIVDRMVWLQRKFENGSKK